jgi:hypothetical protein
VSLTAPTNGATFTAPAGITVSAEAADSDGSVAKVEFFAGATKIGEDTSVPYGISWNNVSAGNYTLTAKATDDDGASTTSGAVNISVEEPAPTLAVTSFTLVNADTDQDIGALKDGDTINLAGLETRNLSVRANVSGDPGSVRFAYDGNSNYQTENVAPYAIKGDNSGDYNPWTPALGSHTLQATPYSGSKATGTAGTALSISFTVTEVVEANLTDDAYLENGTRKNDAYLKVETDSRTRISYLRFDVTGLGGPASAATLSLQVSSDPGSGTLRAFAGSHSNWTETSLTSSNAPSKGAALGIKTGTMANGSTVNLDVTAAVQGSGPVTVILEMDSGGNDVWFSSKEGSVAPELTIQP